jgi:HAD superfamily hydrolase (TIGR01490 family)
MNPVEPRHGPPVTPGKSAVFFDLDKTVIAKASTLAFGGPLYRGGLLARRDVLKVAYSQLAFRLGGSSDEAQMARTRDYVAGLSRGWPVEQVRQIVDETLHELIHPFVYAEAAALIEAHRSAGRAVVLVSASGEEIVAPLAHRMGAVHYCSSFCPHPTRLYLCGEIVTVRVQKVFPLFEHHPEGW